uniref:Uncharacterized protein n=2 Tax=Panagrolaimus sp. PS1159 TaxID=55785 RepID=A0AC35F3B8_9BILA
MSILLNDKTILITNVSNKLGQALSQRLGFAGANLFVSDSNDQKLRKTTHDLKKLGLKVTGAVVDVTVNEQRKQLFDEIEKKYGGLDVLVANPLTNTVKGEIISSTKMEFDDVYNKNLTTPFKLCRDAVPLLSKAKNGGSVIFLTSFAGYSPFEEIGLYSAVSTGLLGLTKAASIDLAKKNIRVNSVVLGMMVNDGSGAFWSDESGDEARLSQLSKLIPLGRIPKSSEATAFVEFLASSRSRYITGENCVVNGGVSVRI